MKSPNLTVDLIKESVSPPPCARRGHCFCLRTLPPAPRVGLQHFVHAVHDGDFGSILHTCGARGVQLPLRPPP